jgi:hypothetical protein
MDFESDQRNDTMLATEAAAAPELPHVTRKPAFTKKTVTISR